jgi:YhcH/YjgK/YiaL family protein
MENACLYAGLSSLLARAFDYIHSTDLSELAPGRYAIDGNNLFVMISEYTTKPEMQGAWEAHCTFIDLQYIIGGTEKIGFGPVGRMKKGVYDPEKDFLPLEGAGDYCTVHKGDFMVLWPDDAHMPGIANDSPTPVKKAVFKIRRQP